MVRVIGTFLILVVYLATVQAGWGGATEWKAAGWKLWERTKKGIECYWRGPILCKVNVEVSYPKGLRIWMPSKSEIKMFGIELYINPAGKNNVCNLCQNTTEAEEDKFILQDDSVIVRKGDVLVYVAITDNGNGIERHQPRRFVVKDYIKSNSSCSCLNTTLPKPIRASNSNSEIQLLERVISNLTNSCSEGQASNYLFLQEESLAEFGNPKEVVKTYFKENPILKPYTNTVIDAEYSETGIKFQVSSIVDKLKILELSQTDNNMLDYDEMYDSSTIIP